MNHPYSKISMANLPFRPLALAGARTESEEIMRIVNTHNKLLADAEQLQEGDQPVVAVVNLFLLGWLNGIRGSMMVNAYIQEQEGFQAAASLLEAEGSFLDAFRSLIQQQKLVLLPIALSQFPLSSYPIEEAAKEDIQRTVILWKELFQTPPVSVWFPRGAFSAGLDELLAREGCRAVFLPADALPSQEPVHWLSPHGLPIHLYESAKGTADYRTQAFISESWAGTELIVQPLLTLTEKSTDQRQQPVYVPFCYEERDGQPLLTPEEINRCEAVFKLKDEWDESCLAAVSQAGGILDVEWAYCVYAALNRLEEEWGSAMDSLRYLLDGARKGFPDLDYAHQRLRLHYGVHFYPEAKEDMKKKEAAEDRQACLLLTYEYPPNIIGGMARHVQGLAEAMAASGRETIVLTAACAGSPDYEQQNGVHVYRAGPLHDGEQNFLKQMSDLNLSLFQKGLDVIGKHAVTLLHTHDWLTGDAAVLLAERHSLPLVTTVHATEHGRNNGIHTDLQRAIATKEKAVMEASDELIVCSQPMKEELRSSYEISGKDIHVIPNGVEFEEAAAARTRFSHLEPFVFSIGRMVFEKGFQTFLDLQIKSLKNKNIQFIIAGKGPLLDTWRKEAEKRNMQERFHFVGYVSDDERRALFHRCEAAVFPSLYEPFGIVALEAMAFQKPVIAAATGGLKSFVLHKQTGLLFEPGNASDLTQQLSAVLDQPDYAKELGRNGREMAKELYSWPRIRAQTEKVYNQTVFIKKMGGVHT